MERLSRRILLAATLATAFARPRVARAEVRYMSIIQPEPLPDGSVLIPNFYNPNEYYQCFPNGQTLQGLASLYSYDGCLGCNGRRQMANGQTLNDGLLTIACNLVDLDSPVKITNLDNGLWTYAFVTDTGGFGKPIVADLTPATSLPWELELSLKL